MRSLNEPNSTSGGFSLSEARTASLSDFWPAQREAEKVQAVALSHALQRLAEAARAGLVPLPELEAAALAGGARSDLADPKGYFVFRYEYEPVYRQVIGDSRFNDLLAKGMMANKDGRYPIVYRIDMTDPESYIVTQSFPIRNRDVLYVSHHPSTDFTKFMTLIAAPLRMGRDVQYLANH